MLCHHPQIPSGNRSNHCHHRNLLKVREVSRAIAKVNDDAEKGIMPKEEEQGKIQNLMGEVLADNLPLKMRKMAFSLNLGFLKVSVETTRGKD